MSFRSPHDSEEGLRFLLDMVARIEDRIRHLVMKRRSHDPTPDDPFRGLYITDEMADLLLADVPRTAEVIRDLGVKDTWSAAPETGRVVSLARTIGLGPTDVELLIICLLPDLDSRFERLYGYLNDDVTRRRATIGLALELAGLSPIQSTARGRLWDGSPLIDNSLVLIEETDRPFLTRGLRVPDRVTSHLLGDDRPDPTVVGLLSHYSPHHTAAAAATARSIQAGQTLIHFREEPGTDGGSVAVAALEQTGRRALCVAGPSLNSPEVLTTLIPALRREAVLQNGGLVVVATDALGHQAPVIIRCLSGLPIPTIFVGKSSWDPQWSDDAPLSTVLPRPTVEQRIELWRQVLPTSPSFDVREIAEQFSLGPQGIRRAANAAHAASLLAGTELEPEHVLTGVRSQNAVGLSRLARHIEPGVAFADIVLPDKQLRQLRELTARARYRDRVLGDWKMNPGGGRGRGVTALFAGDSGTGKTLAAEIIAAELGLDLFAVNLATVVDKYVGETEKNLERIFSEADGINAVLLFDEADAIFGKRSDVRDAHDRYANIESAYLLQRMESFDGLAILTTNLRANLDDAFTRRLDLIVDFPDPDETSRRTIWKRCLREPTPCVDIDFDFCAKSFHLSGGNIRSAAITAGYLAAAGGTPVRMVEVIAAIREEYRKLGRLIPDHEINGYTASTGGRQP